MSVVNVIFAQGERGLLATGHGDLLEVLNGDDVGKSFEARLDTEQAIDVQGLLGGSDPRMRTIARFMPPGPRVKSGDVLRGLNGVKWRVGKLVDNNAESITVDYEIQQQI